MPARDVYYHHPPCLPLADAYAGYLIRKKHPEKHKQGHAYIPYLDPLKDT